MKDLKDDTLQQDLVRRLLKEGLKKDRVIKFLVTSWSMAPLLKPGDYVFLKQVSPKQLQRGDLLVIDQNKDLVIHRLTHIDRNEQFHTKGDNLLSLDFPLTATKILGKVVRIEKYQKVIDLTTPPWARTKWLLGSLSLVESKFVSFITRNPGKIFDHRKGIDQRLPPNRIKDNNNLDCSHIIVRILAMPFRILTRIILWVSEAVS